MKRQILSVILAVCMLCALLPVGVTTVQARSETDIAYPVEGGSIYFDKESGTITGYDYGVEKAVIPDSIEGVAVTSIGDWAFSGCSSLTSVTIPNGVTSIGRYAFYYCSLTSVTIPNSVTSIGSNAFSDCSSLTSVTIPNGVTSIGDSAFSGCSSLTSVTIPNGVTSIGSYAFSGTAIYNAESNWVDGVLYIGKWCIAAKDSLTGAYKVQDGTVGIAGSAFSNCSSLTSVTIPSSVTSIGDRAFSGCSSLAAIHVAEGNAAFTAESGVLFNQDKTVLLYYPVGKADTEYVIPSSVTSIADSAFYGCSSLTSVTIPSSVTSIGDSAFSSCSSLTSVTIPNGVTSIGRYAFYYCSLTSVTIPNSVTSIGSNAFSDCSSLTSVTMPNSVTSIEWGTFSGCSSLMSVTIPNSVTSVGDWAFSDCSSLTSVTIPNSVTSIGSNAFSYCRSLTSVTIPNSVMSIEWDAFSGTAIYNAESNWVDGVLYIGKWCIEAKDSLTGAYKVQDGTVGIADDAFSYCRSLTSVTIPNGVTSIGRYAFSYCRSLTSVTMPNSVTSIGDSAFSWCSSLTSVTIPSSVTSIEWGTFAGCSSLTSVTMPNSVTSVGEGAFSGCGSLTSVTIPNSVTSIGDSAFFDCSSLTSVTIPSSVTSIGEDAFFGCSSLTSVTIPDSVTSIEQCTFSNCSSLTNVTIPNSVTSIAYASFKGCSSLAEVTIPESLESIGPYSFADCTDLRSVYFKGDAPTVEGKVFKNTPGVTLYYIEGKAGWTTPTWNGYPTAIWAHEHSCTEAVTAPTCTEKGYTTYTCTICGESYIDDYVDALGHSLGKWTQTKAPTCTEKGKETGTCSRCEATETRDVAALGHSYKNGVCERCGEKDPNALPPVEFKDVSKGAWYVGAVEYAVQNGLMNGVGDGKFDPEGSMTRAMLVTVLWRYEGAPQGGKNPFTDVPGGQWYTDAVAWAAANGIVGGVGNNRFDPEGKITREQMATILYRYAEKKGIDTSKRDDLKAFPDGGKVESWAKDAVQWAVAEKIINGSDGKLLPQGDATRAQVATILMRFIENIVKK